MAGPGNYTGYGISPLESEWLYKASLVGIRTPVNSDRIIQDELGLSEAWVGDINASVTGPSTKGSSALTGTESMNGSEAATQSVASSALTGTETLSASEAVTQGISSSAISTLEQLLTSSGSTQTVATSAVSALEFMVGSFAPTQTVATSAVTALEFMVGSLASTQSAANTAVSALELLLGSLASTQTSSVSAHSALEFMVASLASTQGAATSASTADLIEGVTALVQIVSQSSLHDASTTLVAPVNASIALVSTPSTSAVYASSEVPWDTHNVGSPSVYGAGGTGGVGMGDLEKDVTLFDRMPEWLANIRAGTPSSAPARNGLFAKMPSWLKSKRTRAAQIDRENKRREWAEKNLR